MGDPMNVTWGRGPTKAVIRRGLGQQAVAERVVMEVVTECGEIDGREAVRLAFQRGAKMVLAAEALERFTLDGRFERVAMPGCRWLYRPAARVFEDTEYRGYRPGSGGAKKRWPTKKRGKR